jgi:hypothetical protein
MYSSLRMLEAKNFRNWMSVCSSWQRPPVVVVQSNCQCGVMHTPLPVLYARGGVLRQRAVELMQGSGATTHVSIFDLLKDVRAALGLDRVRRLLNQRVVVKPRDPGVARHSSLQFRSGFASPRIPRTAVLCRPNYRCELRHGDCESFKRKFRMGKTRI